MDLNLIIIQLLNLFPQTKTIYCDNEAAFNSETITMLVKNGYDIDILNAPPLHSCSIGQIERFYCTLADIATSLRTDKMSDDTVALILRATVAYSNLDPYIRSQTYLRSMYFTERLTNSGRQL